MFTLLDGLESFGEKELTSFLPYLSRQRLEKVSSYKFLPDKISSACVYLLLRVMMKEEYGWDEACLFNFSSNGKPYFSSRADVRFSLSHDRKGVGVCISEKEVGADVQELFHYEKALAERILSPREVSAFNRFFPDDRLLTRIWTMKESLGKKTGEGVFSIMESTSFAEAKEGMFYSDGCYYMTGQKGQLLYCICSEDKQKVRFLGADEFLKKVSLLSKAYI